MKYFNIEKLEKNQEVFKELTFEVIKELKENQSHYARLSGYSRQYVNQLIKNYGTKTKHIDTERIIHLYKVIYLDQSGVRS